MTTPADRDDEGLAEFYAATYSRLVAIVGAVTQDRMLAQDAVGDAFARLVSQWPKVSRYDDPEAWVRRVAFGYVSKRRRKILNGVKATIRHGAAADQPGPTGDAVDLRRALATLPVPQRQVIVLQDLGLSIEDIARELDCAPGTVKSRLSRARAALTPLLREDVSDHV